MSSYKTVKSPAYPFNTFITQFSVEKTIFACLFIVQVRQREKKKKVITHRFYNFSKWLLKCRKNNFVYLVWLLPVV